MMIMNNLSARLHPPLIHFLLGLLTCITSLAAEEKVIAIVRDGDSQFFDGIIKGFSEELKQLSDEKYTFRIKDMFNARYKDGEAARELNKAMADQEVDLIYTAGIAASHHASRLAPRQRTKPVVAGAVEFSNLGHQFITDSGTSNLPNYTFIMSPRRVQADLEAFKKLAKSTSLHALIDQQVIKIIAKDVEKDLAKLHDRLGIDLTITPAGQTAGETLAKLPGHVRFVYLPLLPSMPMGERHKTIKALANKGIMTFSMIGRSDVKAGAFACLAEGSSRPFFRRTAINIHQLLSGISTDLLPVVLNDYNKLTINLATGKKLGWSPDYDTTLTASFINRNVYQTNSGTLNLQQAMQMASRLNPDVIAARAALQAATWQTASLQTNFRPQLKLGSSIGISGVHDRINPITTPHHAGAASLGIEVSQLLYSDRLCSQIKAQAKIAEAEKFNQESARLDVIQTVANSFLDVLNTEALWRIEKENLLLSENNLQLAKLRRDIGAAEASEVFRWHASVAQAKSLLLQRDAAHRSARVKLNVDLAVSRNKQWSLTDISLRDHEFYFMDKEIAPIVRNLNDFRKFTLFLQSLARSRAPEIASFDHTLRSQGILLNERARRNFRPEISISTGISQIVQDTHQTDRDTQTEWTVGLGFTMPLWEGGLRKTEMTRIDALIKQLQAQRSKALFLIEQRALSAAYAMSASHPGMRLSRQARKFSEKNYESVKSKYSQGAVNIVELLDAQNQLLSLKQAEVSAVYQYTRDIISLQRAIAWFEHEKSTTEKKQWSQWLRNYFRTGSIHVATPRK